MCELKVNKYTKNTVNKCCMILAGANLENVIVVEGFDQFGSELLGNQTGRVLLIFFQPMKSNKLLKQLNSK